MGSANLISLPAAGVWDCLSCKVDSRAWERVEEKMVDLLAAGDDSVYVNYQTFMSRGGSYGSSVGGDNAAEPVTQSSLCFDIRKRDTRTG